MLGITFRHLQDDHQDGRCYLSSETAKTRLNTTADARFNTHKRLTYCPKKSSDESERGIKFPESREILDSDMPNRSGKEVKRLMEEATFLLQRVEQHKTKHLEGGKIKYRDKGMPSLRRLMSQPKTRSFSNVRVQLVKVQLC